MCKRSQLLSKGSSLESRNNFNLIPGKLLILDLMQLAGCGMAKWLERSTINPRVEGSNPIRAVLWLPWASNLTLLARLPRS